MIDPGRDPENGDAASERELEKYEEIVFSFGDLMGTHPPLIGDCATLPRPKADILYAMKFVAEAYHRKRELTSDPSLAANYQRMIDIVNAHFTRLARDWQEIAPEDKSAVRRLAGCDTFPDWALPLKLKYIDDKRGLNEAVHATFQAMTDSISREKAERDQMNRAYDIVTKEVLRMEQGAFILRLLFTIGAYVGVTFWLNAVRQTAAIWFVWVLIAVQFFIFITIFVVCSLRAKQCGFRHTWLILVPLILSRINNWEVVVIPVLAVVMVILSARNRNVAPEHQHLLPAGTVRS